MAGRLFAPGNLDLCRMALVASGVGEGQLHYYMARFQEIWLQVAADMPEGDELGKARHLFHWLWQAKPRRYQPGGHFRLSQVIEAQLSRYEEAVGNCLGLTVLYNGLGRGFGLRVEAVYLEEAFHTGPHVFSVLFTPRGAVDIENMLPEGFDYPGHRHNPGRVRWGDREIVADIYLSQGNSFYQAGEWARAVDNYGLALKLHPDWEKAYLNRAMAVEQLKLSG